MKLKKIPKFKNEDIERKFWDTHNVTDYFDFSKAKKAVFPELKPSSKSISIRLPEELVYNLKTIANKRDVPYQSLIKMLLAEAVVKISKPKKLG